MKGTTESVGPACLNALGGTLLRPRSPRYIPIRGSLRPRIALIRRPCRAVQGMGHDALPLEHQTGRS